MPDFCEIQGTEVDILIDTQVQLCFHNVRIVAYIIYEVEYI